MALKLGKASGGVLNVTPVDGVTSTDLVLPLSGTVATEAYADGKTTLTQVKAEISTGSNLVTSPTGTIGYGTGAGGTVTQLTSKSTAVTLNKPTGTITMNNAALAGGGIVTFIVNNSLCNVTDGVYVYGSGTTVNYSNYNIEMYQSTNGIFAVKVTNVSGSTLSDAIVIGFVILKGANS